MAQLQKKHLPPSTILQWSQENRWTNFDEIPERFEKMKKNKPSQNHWLKSIRIFLQLRIFSLQTCGNTGTVDDYVPSQKKDDFETSYIFPLSYQSFSRQHPKA